MLTYLVRALIFVSNASHCCHDTGFNVLFLFCNLFFNSQVRLGYCLMYATYFAVTKPWKKQHFVRRICSTVLDVKKNL